MADFVIPPTLREDNPYAYGSVFLFDEGDFVLDGPNLKIPPSERDKYYTVRNGDDLWNLAYNAYNNSKWWWLIYFANDLELGTELPVGKTLRIPDKQKAQLILP